MILIADSGSTKTDWALIPSPDENAQYFHTEGLNPALLSGEQLKKRILASPQMAKHRNDIREIYFFGAGCGTEKAREKMGNIFSEIFPALDKTIVEEDMLGAVYATSQGDEAIVGILGTGSNSCYYDGKQMHRNVVSLGFILMDEGSANHIGKKLILDYYYKRMPPELAEIFSQTHNMDPDYVKFRLYRSEAPNAYLGEIGGFAVSHKDNAYIQKTVDACLDDFFRNRILPYEKHREVPVHFVGSIAYFFPEILQEKAEIYRLSPGKIIRKPIRELTHFILHHRNKL